MYRWNSSDYASFILSFVILTLAIAPLPVMAGLKEGDDAYLKKDFPVAFVEFSNLAKAGDANAQFNSLSTGYGFQRGNYLVGIGISYNLFDLRRRQLKLSTQKATTDYTLKKLQEQQQLLSVSASQADVEMETALNRLQEIPNQLKAANDGYRQKLSLYKNGLTDIVELDAALNILYRAEIDFMQAKYDYANALFRKAITENQVNSVLNLLK